MVGTSIDCYVNWQRPARLLSNLSISTVGAVPDAPAWHTTVLVERKDGLRGGEIQRWSKISKVNVGIPVRFESRVRT